jgi:hypothetical protein
MPSSSNRVDQNRDMKGLVATRWFVAGLGVALVVGGGSVAPLAQAGLSSGPRAVYVPITPCRLFDTRPGVDNVGGRSTPLGAGETHTVHARGPQKFCNLPADATGVSMNVVVVAGTADSFLTVFPAGTTLPLASNLNWTAGQAPTPNKVDVGLSASGEVSFYNLAGNVHVAVDISGYYSDHDHDDRYYTKSQSDTTFATTSALTTGLAGKANKPPAVVAVGPEDLSTAYPNLGGPNDAFKDSQSVRGAACWYADLPVPNGATMNSVSVWGLDNSSSDISLFLYRTQINNPGNQQTVASFFTSGAQFVIQTWSGAIDPTMRVADTSTYIYGAGACTQDANTWVLQFVVPLTVP